MPRAKQKKKNDSNRPKPVATKAGVTMKRRKAH